MHRIWLLIAFTVYIVSTFKFQNAEFSALTLGAISYLVCQKISLAKFKSAQVIMAMTLLGSMSQLVTITLGTMTSYIALDNEMTPQFFVVLAVSITFFKFASALHLGILNKAAKLPCLINNV